RVDALLCPAQGLAKHRVDGLKKHSLLDIPVESLLTEFKRGRTSLRKSRRAFEKGIQFGGERFYIVDIIKPYSRSSAFGEGTMTWDARHYGWDSGEQIGEQLVSEHDLPVGRVPCLSDEPCVVRSRQAFHPRRCRRRKNVQAVLCA